MTNRTTADSRRAPTRAGVTIEKTWDDNERVTESANGRIYVSAGRWQWIVGDGDDVRTFDRKRDAVAYAQRDADTTKRGTTMKRGYSRAFTPRTDTYGRYLLDKIPATLWRDARARAKRDGVSVRAVLLHALTQFVDAGTDTNGGAR